MRADPLLAVLLVACGDPFVDGTYPGEVLATLRGSVLVEPEGYDWPEAELRVALFWATDGGGLGTEQNVVATTSFPARYELTLHHPPPQEALFQPSWTPVDIAVASPLLYEDVDGDGAWTEGIDDVIGGSPDIALVWSGEVSPPDGDPTAEGWFIDLQLGFQTMWSDRPFCAQDEDAVYFPAQDEPVDLYIGPYWDWLIDWDCDGRLGEWGDLCPEPGVIEAMVQDAPEEVAADPELAACAEILGLWGEPRVVWDDPVGSVRE